MLLLKFIACSVLILFAGRKVAEYGDVIAEKTGLGRLWVGLILMAIATSMPEIFTGVGSVLFVGKPDLSIGNILGANSYNLLNLSILDFLSAAPILSYLSTGQLLTGVLSIIPIAVAALGFFGKSYMLSPLNLSLWSILILVVYVVSVYVIFNYEKAHKISEKLSEEIKWVVDYRHITLKKAWLLYLVYAALIVVGGIWLSYLGDEISNAYNIKASFVGALILGFITTMPEIVVSVSALKLGAKEMAVANQLGSNLFNLSIIFINDLLYRRGDIFSDVSKSNIIMAFVVIIMTAVALLAMILRPKKKLALNLSWYSYLFILIFLVGMYLNYTTR